MATLLAVSDLHVEHAENRDFVGSLRPGSEADWLIVAGDVSDSFANFEWALGLLAGRFARVIWTPGNHELLTQREATEEARGEQRYRELVELCRRLGVTTPEDPYPVWESATGPVVVAPLFLLYDYSFGVNVAPTKELAMRKAYEAGVVCVDEFLLHPDPYPSREAWCWMRVRETAARLDELGEGTRTVLVNHFPLTEAPTRVLYHPEFAQWCGTSLTADWHRRYGASVVVYGHLHIPRTTEEDGVRFEEVSVGYPREWRRRQDRRPALREVLPGAGGA
jgi:3',5'-cyclic AMP phosphodiesterase CpdA